MIIKSLGLQDYEPIWQAMKTFTHTRDKSTPDELWLLEHPPVFTQGQSGKPEHILNPHHIPIIQSDRGGQVTYHGPGQLVAYCLWDIERLNINVRELVTLLENSMIEVLKEYGLTGTANPKAPGVYVNGAKIGSVGLRIHQGASYHGLSLNVNVDLTPFSYINPCGQINQPVTSLQKLGIQTSIPEVAKLLSNSCKL